MKTVLGRGRIGAVVAATLAALVIATPAGAAHATGPTSASAARAGDAITVPSVPGRVFYQDLRSGKLHVGDRVYPGGSVLNLNVSPDGTRVTWVDDSTGNAMMSNLDGTDRRTVHYNVDVMCVEPVWSGDSNRLLVHSLFGTPAVAILYLSGGTGDDLGPAVGCHYRWSADGRRLAALHGDLSGVTVMNLDGSERRIVTAANLGGRVITDLASISADGGRICVHTVPAGEPVGDVARNLWCDTIIDVATNRKIELPVAGQLQAALFQPDGGMLVRVKNAAGSELVLVNADGHVVARTAESPRNAKRALLAYTR